MKIGPFIFKTTLPILPTHPFLWQKYELSPLYSKISKTQPPYKVRVGI